MKLRIPLLALGFCALLLGAFGQSGVEQDQKGEVTDKASEPEVQVNFWADTSAVVPGGEFLLAAYFELPEGWHIYWENAGQSGMPTTVKVAAPVGFKLGPARYPGPKSLELGLGITSFVYEKEVAIFVPITAPADLGARKSFEFSLEAEWLVCREVCFLQNAKLSLSLEAHGEEGTPKKAHAKKLDPQKLLLPRPQANLKGLRWNWLASPPEYRALVVVGGASELDFFPTLESNLALGGLVHNPGGNGYELAADFSMTPGQESDEPRATGLLRVVRKGVLRFYTVNFSGAAQ
ncbi:MAG: protein-disulfide reductase DsbD domain-containing protein [bacterium]|nr:hypothetical protein [Planctomycetota bacterium]HIL52469.1 hypothetical protein [Planctomycetota bacterium]